jgi:FAD synthetase
MKKIKKTPQTKMKVMVFGAFDGLHPGHFDFFRQAKKYGNFLVVSVGLDKNVKKFKGKKPLFREGERLDLVRNCRLVDKAVLGDREEKDFFNHIKKEEPRVICLGYDQWASQDYVLEGLEKVGLLKTRVLRLSSWQPKLAKSKKIKKRWIKGESAIL